MNKTMDKNEELGYDEFFETSRKKLGLESFAVARVISEHRGSYRVRNFQGEYLAKVTGKDMFKSLSREDYPAVGDWVVISDVEVVKAVIQKVLPRKTIIKRKHNNKDEVQVIATNVDVAFVVEAVDRDYNLNRLERYLAIAESGGVKGIIVLNKVDLIDEKELDLKVAQLESRFDDKDFVLVSTLTGEGMNNLEEYIEKGKTYCALGSSGVGKSSVINKLIGRDVIKVGEVGDRSGRGKHTTTTREMYFLKNGGIIIDNPGMREVGMTDETLGLEDVFEEVSALAARCKFSNCTHTHEPGCEVLRLVDLGELDKEKYENYIRLKKEADHFGMTKNEKRKKDRKFGKFLKNTKKEFKKYKHKHY